MILDSEKLHILVQAFEEVEAADSPVSFDFLLQQCLRIIYDRVNGIRHELMDDLISKNFARELGLFCKILWPKIESPFYKMKYCSLLMINQLYNSSLNNSCDSEIKSECKIISCELSEIFAYEELKFYSLYELYINDSQLNLFGLYLNLYLIGLLWKEICFILYSVHKSVAIDCNLLHFTIRI